MIPYNTDAPLYHWPAATVALLAINTLLFFAVPSSLTEFDLSPQQVGGELLVDEDVLVPDEPQEDAWGAGDFQIVDENQKPNLPNGVVAEDAVEEPGDISKSLWRPKLSLEYGVGLKPWQWLTSIFMHHDFFHLLFNMIALWAFGLVVEGKVGALVFLPIYLGIGVVQSGIEQSLMLMADGGGSLGASAAIFGILGIAIVWAPKNCFDVLWSFGFHAGSIEVPILIYGFLQLAIESLSVVLGRFEMSSGILHLMGLALGFGVGWVWLRRRWVDCEGWDLITVMQGKEASIEPDHQLDAEARELVSTSTMGRRNKPTVANTSTSHASTTHTGAPATNRRRKKTPTASAANTGPSATARVMHDVEQLIADGNIAVALKLLAKLKVGESVPQLSQTALHGLVKGLLAAKHFTVALPYMREHIERFTDQRSAMQLNLAKLLLHLQRPRKAVEVLRSMRQGPMDSRVQAAWQELAAHAQHQINEGVVELSE